MLLARRRAFSNLSLRITSLDVKAAIALTALVVLIAPACGKRKPPLPPVPKVIQRAEISGFQRGDRIIISWKMPEKNAPASDIQHIKRVDVYRLAERQNTPLSLNEEGFSARSIVIASVPVRDSDFGGNRMSYQDSLEFAGQPSRLRYAVRFVNAAGQKAPFSNFLVIEPEAKVAAAPTSLSATVSQDAMLLKWNPSEANADGTTPVNLRGYNIYRSDSRNAAGKLLNKNPVPRSEFADPTFEFDKEYFYFVRAVSAGTDGTPTESGESNIVEVKPKDTFRPSPPSSITIAASPDAISLFFPPNPESDVAGYKVFRSEDESLPKSEWKLLTATLLDTTTFQDKQIEKGKTYFYYLLAVDKFGNASEPSDVISETVPE